jgi:hypothetical protein
MELFAKIPCPRTMVRGNKTLVVIAVVFGAREPSPMRRAEQVFGWAHVVRPRVSNEDHK